MAGEKGPGPVPEPRTDAKRLVPVCIEIGDDRCRQLMWPMTMNVLRGRWTRANLIGVTMAPVLAAMPDIPGMRVLVDPARSAARIFDPLAEPANAELLERARRVHKEAFRTEAGAEKAVDYASLSPDELKSWLHCMRRAVDSKHAEVVHGALPTVDQIAALPGKTRMEHYNQSSRAKKFREDDDREEAA